MKKIFVLASVAVAVATMVKITKTTTPAETTTTAEVTPEVDTTTAEVDTTTAEVTAEETDAVEVTAEETDAVEVTAEETDAVEEDDDYSLGICDIPNEYLLGYEAPQPQPKRKYSIGSMITADTIDKVTEILCAAEKEWGIEILGGCHMITYKRREDEYIGKEVTPLLRESIQSWCNAKAEGNIIFNFKDFIVWY